MNTSVTSSDPKFEKYIAFSISAGCYFYQLGIAYYLQQHFNLSTIKFSGASGGSWPAVLLAANEDIKKAFEYVITYAPECAKNRPILGAYMVYDQGIAIVFQKLWSNINLPALVNGRLALSVTRLAWDTIPYLKDEIVTEFYSNQDILECVIASALIPYALNGKPYVIYRNWICADGGITNVTGVRHFAEELVHDIELIEEEIVEQAHQLTDGIVHTLQDELLYRTTAADDNEDTDSENNNNHHHNPRQNNPNLDSAADNQTDQHSSTTTTTRSGTSNHGHLPFTSGPKDIVQFGVTISLTVIDVITESLERLLEFRKRTTMTPTLNSQIDHLLYRPSPLLISIMEQQENKLLQGVLTAIHPSCEEIIQRLHTTSTRLHDQYIPSPTTTTTTTTTNNNNNNNDNNTNNEGNNTLVKSELSTQSTSNLFSPFYNSIVSSVVESIPVFEDSRIPIDEIYRQETHWLGNHFSSLASYPLHLNQQQSSQEIHPSKTIRDDNVVKLSDAPVCLSQGNSFQHLEFRDYHEEDEETGTGEEHEQENISTFTNLDDDILDISCSPPQPVHSPLGKPSSLVKIFPSPSDSISFSDDSMKYSISTGDLSSTKQTPVIDNNNNNNHGQQHHQGIHSTPPPGVGSVDFEGLSNEGRESHHSLSNDYWKRQGDIIKQIPNGGGLQLEISPWMWRHHSIWNYHLSADPMSAIKLFNMGIKDAFDHHEELKRFFDI